MLIMTDKNLNLKNQNKVKLLEKFFQKKIGFEEDLFENGYLDSLKVIDLIFFIEKTTKKKISTKKINQKSFNSYKNILKLF